MVNGEQCRTTKMMEKFKSEYRISITPINLAPQESLLPLETMSRFAEPVIPEGAKRLSGIQKKAATGYPAAGGASPRPVWRLSIVCCKARARRNLLQRTTDHRLLTFSSFTLCYRVICPPSTWAREKMFLTRYVGVFYICYAKKSAKESPHHKTQDLFTLLFFPSKLLRLACITLATDFSTKQDSYFKFHVS